MKKWEKTTFLGVFFSKSNIQNKDLVLTRPRTGLSNSKPKSRFARHFHDTFAVSKKSELFAFPTFFHFLKIPTMIAAEKKLFFGGDQGAKPPPMRSIGRRDPHRVGDSLSGSRRQYPLARICSQASRLVSSRQCVLAHWRNYVSPTDESSRGMGCHVHFSS